MGKSYTEYQLMDTFLENLQQGGNYSGRIARNQSELRREGKSVDKKLFIYILPTN